jgi:hypothetical protein
MRRCLIALWTRAILWREPSNRRAETPVLSYLCAYRRSCPVDRPTNGSNMQKLRPDYCTDGAEARNR